MLGQSAYSRCDETEASLKVVSRGVCLLLGAASELGPVIVLASFLLLFVTWHATTLSQLSSTRRVAALNFCAPISSWTRERAGGSCPARWVTSPALPSSPGLRTSTHCCQSQGWEDCTNNGTQEPQRWTLSCCSGDHFKDLPREADFGGRDKSVRLKSLHPSWSAGRLWPLNLCFGKWSFEF